MKFIESIFSEDEGKGSFSRVATFCLLLASIGWVTHLVVHNHALPDFGGLAMFISMIYGMNLVGKAVNDKIAATPPTSPAAPPVAPHP